MKKDFTKETRESITRICSLYGIQTGFDENGLFVGYLPKNRRIALSGSYFTRIINSNNAVYIEKEWDRLVLIIEALEM